MKRALLVAADAITPYGSGLEACWAGLNSGKSAIARLTRFRTEAFQSDVAGMIDGLEYLGEESLSRQMLRRLFDGFRPPREAKLILASTKGEIDLLEKRLLAGEPAGGESDLLRLLEWIRDLTGVDDRGTVVSAACVSSTIALGRAASRVRAGECDCVLVVACDSVTEFVFSGFSSLMALDRGPARPFDRDRAGLSVGEAAAYALVASEEAAGRMGFEPQAEVAGWGMSCDANHMTGPSRDGAGQARAIALALEKALAPPEEIAAISAHGTGTRYNDSMEMKAFKQAFGAPRPVYSIKGGLGHTMGAAGLLEALVAARAMREGMTPPSLNIATVDEEAGGWVSRAPQEFSGGAPVVSTNSGFGGVNATLVLRPACAPVPAGGG